MSHPILASVRRLLLYLLGWLPPALAGGIFLGSQRPGAWGAGLALGLVTAFTAAFLLLGAWFPVAAHPLARTPWSRLASVHGGALAVTTLVWLTVVGWAARGLALYVPFAAAPELFRDHLAVLTSSFVLLFLLAVVASYQHLTQDAARRAERRALELQVTAREAELKALRAQLDPHFLFNSLNSLSALCGHDPAGARRMIDQLAIFLRRNLELSGQERILLGRELELALAYLQVERVRFGERLSFVYEVDEAAAAMAVPPLILQPLVENAVKHGIAQLVDGGTIHLRAKRRGDTLYLVVENPCDPDGPSARGTELGLENVRRRLAAAYGDRALLVVDRKPGEFRAEVRLPGTEAEG